MFNFLRIALRALLLNKVRSLLTMLGVIIGVSAVIILTSIVGGLEKTIKTQFESFGSNSLFIFPGHPGQGRGPGGTVVNKLTYDLGQDIRRVAGVLDTSAQVFVVGNVEFKNKTSKSVTVNGVEENFSKITAVDVAMGRFFSASEVAGGKMVTVIGPTVKENLFGNASSIGQTISIKDKKFTVIGVLEKQGAIFGQDQDNEVYLPLSVARTRFNIDRPNFFYIKVNENENIKLIAKRLERFVEKRLDPEDFSVVSQEQSIAFITNILGVLSTALGGIAAISLLVGGVGIMNIMFVSVTERTREIGLRKAVGANSNNILTQFLIEAVILSVLGGLIGVLLGILISLVIGQFIDTQVNLMYVMLSFVVSAVIGIVFGVAPAFKASRLDPIVALRYE